jgi:dehydrogenase/reductase SDR family protein 1
MAAKPLIGKIALVTGASRGIRFFELFKVLFISILKMILFLKGIGKGIALQLGEAGAKVYITGRTLNSKNGVGSLLGITKSFIVLLFSYFNH